MTPLSEIIQQCTRTRRINIKFQRAVKGLQDLGPASGPSLKPLLLAFPPDFPNGFEFQAQVILNLRENRKETMFVDHTLCYPGMRIELSLSGLLNLKSAG